MPPKKIFALAAGSAVLFTGMFQYSANAVPIAESGAQALEIKIGGQNVLTAPRVSTLDSEDGAAFEGSETPLANLAPGLLDLGVLSQVVDAYVNNEGHGTDATAEVASLDLNLAEIDGANALDLPSVQTMVDNAVGTIDLSGLGAAELEDLLGLPNGTLTLLPVGQLDPFVQQVEDALNGVAGSVAPAVQELLAALDANVELRLGALRSNAEAFRTKGTDELTRSGNAVVDNARVVLTLAGEETTILTLPSASEPNTVFTEDLGSIVELLRTEALDDFAADLDQILGNQLTPVYDPLLEQIEANLIEQIDAAAEPLFEALNESLITGTVNKQVISEDGIDVIALELQVLPAAASLGFGPAVEAKLAHSRAAAVPFTSDEPESPNEEDEEDPRDPSTPSEPTPTREPSLPSFVDSGA